MDKQNLVRHLKVKWFLVCVLSSGLLMGCQSAQNDMDAAKEKALAEASAFDGYRVLRDARAATIQDCTFCSDAFEIAEAHNDTMVSLLETALDEGNPQAYLELYSIPEFAGISGTVLPLKRGYIEKFLILAEADNASSSALVNKAGKVLVEGRHVVRDDLRAIKLFAKAWRAGLERAAGNASEVFYERGELLNAYLWGLRCINECNLSRGNLSQFSEGLDSDTVLAAQRAARDREIVSLPSANVFSQIAVQ